MMMAWLTELKAGDRARIIDIAEVDVLLRRRLIDLGVMEGTLVRVSRLLPFGGPLTLDAAGQEIGIRRRNASQIRVEMA